MPTMHRQQARAAKILTLRLQGLEDLIITGRTGWTVTVPMIIKTFNGVLPNSLAGKISSCCKEEYNERKKTSRLDILYYDSF